MTRALLSLVFAASLVLSGSAGAETARQPGTMSVAVFMAKAAALEAKGALALFSSDFSVLKTEVASSAQAFRRQIKAEAASGKPSACPPERAALTSDDILVQMRGYPVDARPRILVSVAIADLIRKRYPCPAH